MKHPLKRFLRLIPYEDDEAVEDVDLILLSEDKEEEPEEIPDWLSELDDSGAEEAPIQDLEAVSPFEDAEEIVGSQPFTSLVDADQEVEQVPDWMREMDEAQEQDDSAPVPGITAAAGAAALGAVFAGQEDEQITSGSDLESEDAKQDEDEAAEPLPDWMSSAGVEQEQMVAAELDDFEDELTALGPDDLVEEDLLGAPGEQGETEQLPDWMSVAEPAAGNETPDWLKDAMESTDEDGDALPRADFTCRRCGDTVR